MLTTKTQRIFYSVLSVFFVVNSYFIMEVHMHIIT